MEMINAIFNEVALIVFPALVGYVGYVIYLFVNEKWKFYVGATTGMVVSFIVSLMLKYIGG